MPSLPQSNGYTGVTAGVAMVARKCAVRLCSLSAAAATATATLYDNTSATGNPILTIAAPINQTIFPDMNGYECNIGLFVVVTGAGAQLTVLYE